MKERLEHVGREAQPDVPHLALVLLAVVRLHVDDQQPATRLERARGLEDDARRVGNVAQGQTEQRDIESGAERSAGGSGAAGTGTIGNAAVNVLPRPGPALAAVT